MKPLTLFVCILLTATAVTCTTTGPGGEQDLILIPTSQEVELGKQFDQQIRSENKIYNDPVWNAYFDSIGQSIVAVSDRKDIEYHFTIIESDQINAFAVPGGYIYIYTGMLDVMQSQAELAAVTSHEVSHVVARHSIQRIQQVLGISLVLNVVLGDADNQAIQQVINVGLAAAMSGYSRSWEREADRYGIIYMKQAGYNPNGTIDMFERLAANSEGERNFFEDMFATHPETQERIQNARDMIVGMDAAVTNRPIHAEKYQQLKQRLPH